MSNRSPKISAVAVMAVAGVGDKAAQAPSAITLVVGVAAGGSTDVSARAIANKIEEMSGPRFVIENRGGGGGIPAAIGVKDAPPDGRTLFVASYAPFVVSRAMSQNFPFDPTTDFRPITTLFTFPLLLMVPAEVKAKSVAELVALSKSRPEGITYGSQGVGTAGHLLGEMFAKATGANLVHVPYKGASQAVIDLVAGRLDMMFIGTLPTMPHIKGGKLRPLAATAGKRPTACRTFQPSPSLAIRTSTRISSGSGSRPRKTPLPSESPRVVRQGGDPEGPDCQDGRAGHHPGIRARPRHSSRASTRTTRGSNRSSRRR
jgi:tripartite-type tricarboxylate transporter receptor subunit TctC